MLGEADLDGCVRARLADEHDRTEYPTAARHRHGDRRSLQELVVQAVGPSPDRQPRRKVVGQVGGVPGLSGTQHQAGRVVVVQAGLLGGDGAAQDLRDPAVAVHDRADAYLVAVAEKDHGPVTEPWYRQRCDHVDDPLRDEGTGQRQTRVGQESELLERRPLRDTLAGTKDVPATSAPPIQDTTDPSQRVTHALRNRTITYSHHLHATKSSSVSGYHA